MALKWYTRARKFPQLIGRTPDGTRIPGGPYTYTQVAAGVVTAVVLAQTTWLWAHGGLILNATIFIGATVGAVFAAGTLMLEGEEKPLLPAILEPLSDNTARLIIEEGRYHQVRRMFAAVGNHVVELHRDRIGGLTLPQDLEPGAFRVLPAATAEQVFGA